MPSVFKSYFRFPKSSKKRFGEGGKRLSKKRKIKAPIFSIITVHVKDPYCSSNGADSAKLHK